jgi:hypothetical protein
MPAFQSTLTKFSSPYRPATGLYFGAPIWQLTASGSGLGTDVAPGFVTKAKSATGSGIGTQSGSGTRVVLRTAADSAVGNYTIVISGPTQLRLGAVTDFSFPFLNGGRFYLGPAYYLRTAADSALGSESSTFIRGLVRSATGTGFAGESTSTDLEILFRQATGSGVSTEEADPFLFVIRTATGSGTGTSSAVFLRKHLRVATGSGLGTDSAVRLVKSIRTATGSGLGSQVATGRLVAIRTASASGEGTSSSVSIELLPRTASGSGVGATSGNAEWIKSRIFRVPNTTNYAFAELFGDRMADRLFAHMPPGVRVENLYRLTDGSYTINDPGYGRSTRAYLGGHNIFLDDTEVAELTAAGYGAYIS